MSDPDTVIFTKPIPWGEFNADTAEAAEEEILTAEEIAAPPPAVVAEPVIQPPVDLEEVEFQQIKFRAHNGFATNQDCRILLNRIDRMADLLGEAYEIGYGDAKDIYEGASREAPAKKAPAKKAAPRARKN